MSRLRLTLSLLSHRVPAMVHGCTISTLGMIRLKGGVSGWRPPQRSRRSSPTSLPSSRSRIWAPCGRTPPLIQRWFASGGGVAFLPDCRNNAQGRHDDHNLPLCGAWCEVHSKGEFTKRRTAKFFEARKNCAKTSVGTRPESLALESDARMTTTSLSLGPGVKFSQVFPMQNDLSIMFAIFS